MIYLINKPGDSSGRPSRCSAACATYDMHFKLRWVWLHAWRQTWSCQLQHNSTGEFRPMAALPSYAQVNHTFMKACTVRNNVLRYFLAHAWHYRANLYMTYVTYFVVCVWFSLKLQHTQVFWGIEGAVNIQPQQCTRNRSDSCIDLCRSHRTTVAIAVQRQVKVDAISSELFGETSYRRTKNV